MGRSSYCSKPRLRALISGHSHVHWLKKYLKKNVPGSYRHFAVTQGIKSVRFLSKRGGRLSWLCSRATFKNIRRERPNIIILCFGGNDLDSKVRKPGRVAMDIYNCAKEILRTISSVQQIAICQIVRRESWRELSLIVGNIAVDTANELLEAVCDGHPNMFFWKHRGLLNPQKVIFRPEDGVHYNDGGNKLLFRSIRGALLFAAKRASV